MFSFVLILVQFSTVLWNCLIGYTMYSATLGYNGWGDILYSRLRGDNALLRRYIFYNKNDCSDLRTIGTSFIITKDFYSNEELNNAIIDPLFVTHDNLNKGPKIDADSDFPASCRHHYPDGFLISTEPLDWRNRMLIAVDQEPFDQFFPPLLNCLLIITGLFFLDGLDMYSGYFLRKPNLKWFSWRNWVLVSLTFGIIHRWSTIIGTWYVFTFVRYFLCIDRYHSQLSLLLSWILIYMADSITYNLNFLISLYSNNYKGSLCTYDEEVGTLFSNNEKSYLSKWHVLKLYGLCFVEKKIDADQDEIRMTSSVNRQTENDINNIDNVTSRLLNNLDKEDTTCIDNVARHRTFKTGLTKISLKDEVISILYFIEDIYFSVVLIKAKWMFKFLKEKVKNNDEHSVGDDDEKSAKILDFELPKLDGINEKYENKTKKDFKDPDAASSNEENSIQTSHRLSFYQNTFNEVATFHQRQNLFLGLSNLSQLTMTARILSIKHGSSSTSEDLWAKEGLHKYRILFSQCIPMIFFNLLFSLFFADGKMKLLSYTLLMISINHSTTTFIYGSFDKRYY